jgi:hypothetical protein
MIYYILVWCAIFLPLGLWYVDAVVKKDLDKWDIKE